jgi:small subunit ribosomal protein S20
MPNIKSAKKRMRQNEKLRIANRNKRSSMRTAVKKLRGLIIAGDAEAAKTLLPETLSAVNKAAAKGLIKKNTAARSTSRLTVAVNSMSSES